MAKADHWTLCLSVSLCLSHFWRIASNPPPFSSSAANPPSNRVKISTLTFHSLERAGRRIWEKKEENASTGFPFDIRITPEIAPINSPTSALRNMITESKATMLGHKDSAGVVSWDNPKDRSNTIVPVLIGDFITFQILGIERNGWQQLRTLEWRLFMCWKSNLFLVVAWLVNLLCVSDVACIFCKDWL